jgi:predicted transcriptional regulator
MGKSLFVSERERSTHQDEIHRLGNLLGIPEEKVREIYESELSLLAEDAKIRDYLAILVSHRVKIVMEERGGKRR